MFSMPSSVLLFRFKTFYEFPFQCLLGLLCFLLHCCSGLKSIRNFKTPDKNFGLFTTTTLIVHLFQLFFNRYTPKTIKDAPIVTTSRVGEIKQKHTNAPPNVTVIMGSLLFFELLQTFPRLLGITPPPFSIDNCFENILIIIFRWW